MKISNKIDKIIENAIDNYNGACTTGGSFEKLLSFGELVDRLSIVNFKLFTLKNKVVDKGATTDFKSWAALEDVKLVEERARLKNCIDEKLITMIHKISSGDKTGGHNQEVKTYGNKL